VDRGVAVLGLADKYNSTGAVIGKKWYRNGSLKVKLCDGGAFVAWTEKPPREVTANGKRAEFSHDAATGRLSAALPLGAQTTVVVRW
jgi:raffinose synthase